MSEEDPRPTGPSGVPPREPDLKLIEDVFFKVAPLAPADREEAIRHLCAGLPALEAEVRSLLASAARVGVFLERPALGKDVEELANESRRVEPPDELIGAAVGAFRIERRIAAGGMGTVYLGVRSDGQFDQKVAVKVIKRGMDSEQILARFRAEIHALAALDHPNIARLIDGGVMSDGRPYLAMEYVDGAPIDEYCDQRSLKLRDRIELFRKVCDAVHHAHQNLVIHRDIKPSNLLVTPQGVPKLLDFGIAKLLKGGDTEPVLTTEADRRLTPEYASPEQVDGGPVSTATDIYALGVVLYELLAGVRPYTFAVRTEEEVRRVVCHLVPPPPSAAVTVRPSRVGTSSKGVDGSAGVTPAAQAGPGSPTAANDTAGRTLTANIPRTRGMTSTRLRSSLRGDLDNIVMYALRKEPQRRYSSADQFSSDLGRYLDGLPVLARRDTVVYRVSKFARRHRVLVVLIVVALFSHALLTGMLYGQRVRLTQQRDELTVSNHSLVETRKYLTQIFEAGGSGVDSLGPDAKLGQVIEEALRQLRDNPPDDPLTRAAAEQSLGQTSMSLGMLSEARALLESAERAFGTLDPEADVLVDTQFALAELLFYERKTDDAKARFVELLDRERARSGGVATAREGDLLNAIGACQRIGRSYAESIATQREALAIRTKVHGEHSLQVAETRNNLGSTLFEDKQNAEAIKELEASLAIRSSLLRMDHPLVVRCRANLGLVQLRAGLVGPAVANLKESVDLWDRALGPAHAGRVAASTSLSQALMEQKNYDEALGVLERTLAWQREHIAPESTAIAATETNIALTLAAAGRVDEARPILTRTLPRLEAEGRAYEGLVARAKKAMDQIDGRENSGR